MAQPVLLENCNQKPDEKRVFLALRGVFVGSHSKFRKIKKIREVIENHKNEELIRSLIKDYNVDKVCAAAKALLDNRIFESPSKAQLLLTGPGKAPVIPTAPAAMIVSERAIEDAVASKAINDELPKDTLVKKHNAGPDKGKARMADGMNY